MKYVLEIAPRPTPRPRLSKFGAYNEPEYTKYKNDLIYLIRNCKIEQAYYDKLYVKFYFPYPKSTPKNNMIDGMPHRKKPDIDNLFKGLADALEKAGLIKNDSQIHICRIEKNYTTGNPKIEFELL